MIDDLKKAYSSYQQALYYMPNPQVRILHPLFRPAHVRHRNPSFGTVSGFCTIATGAWSMQRRRSQASSGWIPVRLSSPALACLSGLAR